MTTDDDVQIILSRDQALVLSDWLSRRMTSPQFADVIDDRAVWSAFLRISGVLDKALVEPFRDDYDLLLDAARERLNLRLGDFGQEQDGK